MSDPMASTPPAEVVDAWSERRLHVLMPASLVFSAFSKVGPLVSSRCCSGVYLHAEWSSAERFVTGLGSLR
jgi:hypothetical protein